jgi:hypothetical protein
MRTAALAAAAVALMIWAAAAFAPTRAASATLRGGPNYTFGDGSKGFAFDTAGGIVNPEVLVGFNPQPDPPGFSGDIYTPEGGGARIFTPPSATGYQFELSFLGLGSGRLATPMAPNSDGVTGESFRIGDNTFDVTIAFSGPAAARDWAAFNPQPDPPGRWFGSTFDFGAVGDPTATIRITENGAPLSLSLAAPEPSAWALVIIGVGAVGMMARGQRRDPARV